MSGRCSVSRCEAGKADQESIKIMVEISGKNLGAIRGFFIARIYGNRNKKISVVSNGSAREDTCRLKSSSNYCGEKG